MLVARLAAALLAALVLTGTVQARSSDRPTAPQGLKPFLLRADEAEQRTFPRTPSFAWLPVEGAMRYEFELAKSPSFNEGSVFWSNESLRVPAVSVPVALPWMTGNPYAVYARVRAVTKEGVSPWSEGFGFNVRWTSLPQPVTAYPGLSRWSVVDGATGYHVWFPDLRKVVATRTNAVDHREFYSFHQQPSYSGTVRWRVRAVRSLYGSVPSGLPTVTYGPWSPVHTATNPPISVETLRTVAAVSDSAETTNATPSLHELTPAFSFAGNKSSGGDQYELYRVYVFSDSDCVNVIYRGAVVGSPAYAPRLSGPLDLPQSVETLNAARGSYLDDGKEGKTFMADGASVRTTESDPPPKAPGDTAAGTGGSGSSGSSGGSSGGDEGDPAATTPDADESLPSTPAVTGAPVELWDSGWPNGRFYWTVVPVRIEIVAGATTALSVAAAAGATSITVENGSGFAVGDSVAIGPDTEQQLVTVNTVTANVIQFTPALEAAHAVATPVRKATDSVQYFEMELPQDVCQSGRIQAFGKTSRPVTTARSEPFVAGLSPSGRLVAAASAAPKVFGSPLVAWQPALGADQYQLQWSKSAYPWRKAGEKITYATSAMLPLTPGRWWYRVRGINFHLPGTARALSWSQPLAVVVTSPKFSVVGSTLRPALAPRGYTTWTRHGSGFSIALPRTWVALPKSDRNLALGDLAKPRSPLRLLAVDPAATGGFATNVNVLVEKKPRKGTFRAFKASTLADAKRLATSPVDARVVRLAGGTAYRLAYTSKKTSGTGAAVHHVHYAFLGARRQFVLSFATAPGQVKRYRSTFATVAGTFRFSG